MNYSLLNCHKVKNVLLNDTWGNVSVSDTASCRTCSTSVL